MISKKMKQVVTFILAFIMVFGAVTTAVFADNSYINDKSESEKIQELVNKGYISGYSDGTLGEDNFITRAEFTAIAVRALGLEELSKTLKNTPTGFPDVDTYDWHNGYVGVAKSKNIISGYPDNTFKPENNVTYGEVLTIMTRMLLTPKEQIQVKNSAKWPVNYYMKAAELGVLDDISGAKVKEKATRGKVFLILSNVVNILEENGVIESDATKVNVLVTDNSEKSLDLVVLKDSEDFEKGDELKLKNNKELMEKLSIGDVYDVEITKAKKIISIEENEDAKVKTGKIRKKRRDFLIDEKTYDTDSLVSLNYNGKEVKFNRFPYQVEFSKATIFDKELVYIDAHNFDEILPIKEIKNDRIYGITKEGYTKIVSARRNTTIYLIENGSKNEIKLDDIKEGDIAHIKRDRSYVDIFITQNTIKGKIDKINTKNKKIEINEEEYELEDNKYSAILAQGRRYIPITNINRLKSINDHTIEASINLNGKIQLIETDKDVSIYNKAVIESVGKDRVDIVTEDGYKETVYVTEYTELLDDRYDRDDRDDRYDRYDRYNVERIMSKLERGDLVKVLVDGRGDIEELEILEGKEGVISYIDWDIVEIDGKDVYLSEDYVVFSVSGGKYETEDKRDFEDIFYKNRDARVKALIFEENREVEGFIIKKVSDGLKAELEKAIKNTSDELTMANKYKKVDKIKSAINAVDNLIVEANDNVNKWDDNKIENHIEKIKTAIEKLNKEVFEEFLKQINEKIAIVENSNKLYNKEALQEIVNYHTTVNALEEINFANLEEAEKVLNTFEEKVYENITEVESKLNKLRESLNEEIEKVEVVLERVAYNDKLVNDYKSFLNGLSNAIVNIEDVKTVEALQENLNTRKNAFDKDKFNLSEEHPNIVEVFMLEERIEVSKELLKEKDDSNEAILLEGEVKKAKSFVNSLKNKNPEDINIDKLNENDSSLKNALVAFAAKLNVKTSGNTDEVLLIAEAEIAYNNLIVEGKMNKAFELNDLIYELKSYIKYNAETLSKDEVKERLVSFLDGLN